MKECGIELGYGELEAAIREMDTDGNNLISLDEFKRWWGEQLVKLPSVLSATQEPHTTAGAQDEMEDPV